MLERELIFKEDNGIAIHLKEIQESSNEGTLENSITQHEEEIPVNPVDNSLPLHRSTRVSMSPTFYGFHIMSDGDIFIGDKTLINLDEPANYKEEIEVF